MKLKKTLKSVMALSMAVMTVFPTLPTAFAAQQNSYHDPAEHWQEANDRTNELDANAVITHETFQCRECKQPTSFLAYRTPEYTRDGETAMNRNVKYSDGTTIDGDGKGNVNDGTPGKDAYYTGYHWTKSVCETCGTINSNMAKTDYSYGKNVYWLYDCAANFFENLPESVEIEQVDRDYHRVVTTGGQYCGFCYGTYHTEDTKLERHNMETSIRPELAHQRFVEMTACADCGYTKTSYTAAKAVVADYYGVADGTPHTVTVSDLSEAGVTTAIRYGHSADACTLTSAPNYTEAGNYTVYYKITYTYADTDMVEDGVAYVHLTSTSDGSCGCGCGDPDCDCQNPDCGGDCCNQECTHHFVCHDTVPPTCVAMGYDRMMCTECGKMVKANYKNALDHAYQSVIVREATCETPGKTMDICERCGNVKESTIPQTEHEYETQVLPSTCTSPGYTLNECTVCGDRHITDITPALSHDYAAKTIPAGCETGGKTIHTCAGCGSAFVTDYTEPLGHSWDEGTEITGSTCTGEGMTEYTCTRCGATRLEGDAAAGHIPGEAATCTTPQLCTKCGAVIANALGHDYQKKITAPTCTEMGYTTCTCSRCGDTYKDDYTDAAGHKLSDWIIDNEPTTDSKGSKHKECTVCGETLETAEIEKIYNQATTDSKGEAIVGGYLVTVSDTDTKNPVAGATVNLHEDKSLSIHLPSGRLLDYADQTTITVLLTKDKSAVADMFIAVTDQQDNYCADSTDVSGQITVPNNGGTTNSDGNATAGWEDADGNRHTLTIKVERTETGRPIQGSEVNIGATGNITVTLPEGQDMDASNRITITVTDNKKTPQPDQTVIVKTDLGSAAQGQTNKDGKLTVPSVDSVYTDESGTAVVGQYTVIVTDTEKAPIKGALVTLLPGTDDAKDAFTVLLPNGRLLDGNDQTIVTVLLPNTNPAKGFHVKVSDAKDNHTAKDTDKNGQVIVPDATGSSGEIVGTDTGSEEQSNTVNVDVADQDGKPIDDAQIAVDKNGEVSITLPDDFDFDKNGSVTVTVTDNQGEGKPNVNVTVTDAAGNTAVGETGKDGIKNWGKV